MKLYFVILGLLAGSCFGILDECPVGKPLPGVTCGRYSNCPSGHYCVAHFGLCCINICPRGLPFPGVDCGRRPGSRRCPAGYYCIRDPADRSSPCCPILKYR